jgi:hypothetical protein
MNMNNRRRYSNNIIFFFGTEEIAASHGGIASGAYSGWPASRGIIICIIG